MKPGKDFKKNTWEESIKAWRILVVRACGGFRRNNTMSGACVSGNPISAGMECSPRLLTFFLFWTLKRYVFLYNS